MNDNPTKQDRDSQDRIIQLRHTSHSVALRIQQVFQSAYRIEARLIGVVNFPPLERTVRDIIASDTVFYGLMRDDDLIAVVEIDYDEPLLDICSLVVDPAYFRQGLAGQLLRYVLNHYPWETAEVETAVANTPAITLYEQLGFAETARFTTPGGISKVSLRL